MARQQPTDHLPAHVLARRDFIDACAARDLGAVLRLAKQKGGVGFTASHLARRCEMTVSRVQDYIYGRVSARNVEVFERVADGLHIPGAMFDLARRPWESDIERQSPATDPTKSGDPSVLRREFMKLGAGLAAARLGSDLPSPPTGGRVGQTMVSALQEDAARLRKLDVHLGGADTYPVYKDFVAKIAGLLKDTTSAEPVRQELLVLLSEQAQQAGWAAFDAGWHDQAVARYQESFDAAKAANAGDLAANALALRAYQMVSQGQDSTKLTDRSREIAHRSASPAVRSLLCQRAAWTYAVADRPDDVARALGEAEQALALDGDVPDPDWAAWAHNDTELGIMAGRCWAELRRPLRAVPALEQALGQYGDEHARDKALYLSWLADAYIDAGEIDPAATALDRAVALSTNVASPRPADRIGSVVGRLKEFESTPSVSALLARRPLDPVQVRS